MRPRRVRQEQEDEFEPKREERMPPTSLVKIPREDTHDGLSMHRYYKRWTKDKYIYQDIILQNLMVWYLISRNRYRERATKENSKYSENWEEDVIDMIHVLCDIVYYPEELSVSEDEDIYLSGAQLKKMLQMGMYEELDKIISYLVNTPFEFEIPTEMPKTLLRSTYNVN